MRISCALEAVELRILSPLTVPSVVLELETETEEVVEDVLCTADPEEAICKSLLTGCAGEGCTTVVSSCVLPGLDLSAADFSRVVSCGFAATEEDSDAVEVEDEREVAFAVGGGRCFTNCTSAITSGFRVIVSTFSCLAAVFDVPKVELVVVADLEAETVVMQFIQEKDCGCEYIEANRISGWMLNLGGRDEQAKRMVSH